MMMNESGFANSLSVGDFCFTFLLVLDYSILEITSKQTFWIPDFQYTLLAITP